MNKGTMVLCIDKESFDDVVPLIEKEIENYSDVFNLNYDENDSDSIEPSKRHNIFFFMYYVIKKNLVKISDTVQFYQTCIDSNHKNSEKLIDILSELNVNFSILNNEEIWVTNKIE